METLEFRPRVSIAGMRGDLLIDLPVIVAGR
jgi:hypothetical protein